MPQLRFRLLSTANNNDNNAPWIPFAAAAGTENGARSWIALQTLIGNGTAVVTTAPTGIQSYDYQWEVGGVLTGNSFTLGVGVTSASGDHAVTLPAAVSGDFGGASTRRHNIDTDKNNTPPNQQTRYAFRYDVPGEDNLNWVQCGNQSDNITIAATNRFLTWEWCDNVGVTTTEATTQIPWPVSGKFKYFIVYPGITGGDTADFALRKNGSDALVFNTTGTTTILDTTSEVVVSAGDLINWRYNRTSGAGTSCSPLLVAGFVGD